MGLSRRHECRRVEHRGARGLIPGMTAQGPPTSLRQAAQPRSPRRWPLAPGHWAELDVACGGSLRSAGIEVKSNVQTSYSSAGLHRESVTGGLVLKRKD
jgi:hypothetical protein